MEKQSNSNFWIYRLCIAKRFSGFDFFSTFSVLVGTFLLSLRMSFTLTWSACMLDVIPPHHYQFSIGSNRAGNKMNHIEDERPLAITIYAWSNELDRPIEKTLTIWNRGRDFTSWQILAKSLNSWLKHFIGKISITLVKLPSSTVLIITVPFA